MAWCGAALVSGKIANRCQFLRNPDNIALLISSGAPGLPTEAAMDPATVDNVMGQLYLLFRYSDYSEPDRVPVLAPRDTLSVPIPLPRSTRSDRWRILLPACLDLGRQS